MEGMLRAAVCRLPELRGEDAAMDRAAVLELCGGQDVAMEVMHAACVAAVHRSYPSYTAVEAVRPSCGGRAARAVRRSGRVNGRHTAGRGAQAVRATQRGRCHGRRAAVLELCSGQDASMDGMLRAAVHRLSGLRSEDAAMDAACCGPRCTGRQSCAARTLPWTPSCRARAVRAARRPGRGFLLA